MASGYDNNVKKLREIRELLFPGKSDYIFAKELIEQPVIGRLEWIREQAYAVPINNYKEIIGILETLE